ncbi:MAG: hypothetical protein R3E68_00120 [Burkholderiaceae bacterium]
MPLALLRQDYHAGVLITDDSAPGTQPSKVSTPVALRRLFDAGFIDEPALWQNYREELARIRRLTGAAAWWRLIAPGRARTGKRRPRRAVEHAGGPDPARTPSACWTGKTSTFYEAAPELGVML